MKKKNLEKKVICAGAYLSGLDQPKEEIGLVGTYMHPCMARISYYVSKEEIGLLKRYSRNERANHKKSRGHYQ